MFSVERLGIMIKDEKQRTVGMENNRSHHTKNPSHSGFMSNRRHFFRFAFKMPMRRGVSQQVLDTADRMIEEYKPDLEYLKDK